SGLRPPHPFGRASKKPLNSERGPREPKSDAKLQPIFHTAKYLRGFFRKKRDFNCFLHIRADKGGATKGRTHILYTHAREETQQDMGQKAILKNTPAGVAGVL
ncbi:MAG: hypothetical protein IKX31_11070, partial [Muribaculaceae bacterium]|nr:hypothetical protein [Muribaculaceae bacterium]